MRDLFAHFYALDEGTVKKAVQGGIVAPDTNVLLNLYRFQGGAREDLFGALESLQDRLWIPHQVGLEFQRRRIGVIADQERYFTSTQRELKQLIDSIREKAEAFPTRIGLDKERTQEILRSIGSLSAILNEEISKAGRANEVRIKNSDNDKVLKRLEALVADRVGEQMAPAELQAARAEALRRMEAGLPPGYEDNGKADPTGDYLVFRQLMDKAKQCKLPVVLVTDDEKKDWYRREQGKPLGARPELREEMMAEAGVPFVIMTTATFLRHVKAYLDFDVASETIDQAKELPGVLDESERLRTLRRNQEHIVMRIRMQRNHAAQTLNEATAHERSIHRSIALADEEDDSIERLKGELEAGLVNRLMADLQLSALIEQEKQAVADLAAIQKSIDLSDT